MLSSKHLLLISLGLASATLLCPPVARPQNADSQQPNQNNTTVHVRRCVRKYLCSASPEEIEQGLSRKNSSC
jgi:hypothetical protein